MLFNEFISNIMRSEKRLNLKLTLTTEGKYFTNIGDFTFEELNNHEVKVSSSNFSKLICSLGELLDLVGGIKL